MRIICVMMNYEVIALLDFKETFTKCFTKIFGVT